MLALLLIKHRLQQVEKPEKISPIKTASQPPIDRVQELGAGVEHNRHAGLPAQQRGVPQQ